MIIKVVLKNGEMYALDLTGAQFGHFDVISPWQTYVDCQIQHIEKVAPLGYSRTVIDNVAFIMPFGRVL